MKTKLLDLVQFTMRSWLIKEVFRFEGNTVLGEGVANTILKNTGRNRQHRWKYCAQQWIYKYDPENTGSNRRRSWKYCARRRRLFVIFTLGTRSIVVHLQGRDAFFVKLTYRASKCSFVATTGSFRKNGKSKTVFMGTKFHEKLIFSAFLSRELATNLRC